MSEDSSRVLHKSQEVSHPPLHPYREQGSLCYLVRESNGREPRN